MRPSDVSMLCVTFAPLGFSPCQEIKNPPMVLLVRLRNVARALARVTGVGTDDGRHAASGLFAQRQLGQQQRIGRTHGAWQRETLACLQFG